MFVPACLPPARFHQVLLLLSLHLKQHWTELKQKKGQIIMDTYFFQLIMSSNSVAERVFSRHMQLYMNNLCNTVKEIAL